MLIENAKMAELKNFGTLDEVREFPKAVWNSSLKCAI